MWLSAEGNLRPENEQLTFAHSRLHDRNRVAQVTLSPRPAASERVVVIKPRDRPYRFERRLRLQIGIYAAAFAVVTVLAVTRIVGDGMDPLWPLVGFAVGLVIGASMSRGRPLRWDAAGQQVVSSLSIFGIAVTVLYLAFRVLRDRVAGGVGVMDNVTVASVTGLTITAGVMLGRVLVTTRGIRRVLTDAGRIDERQGPGA